jgi:hypothetical protein
MRSIRLIVTTILYLTLLFLLLSTSCALHNHSTLNPSQTPDQTITSTSNGQYWIEDKDTIDTNDYQKLQKVIPFTVVFPKFIPDELKERPPAFIFIKSIYSNPNEPQETNKSEVRFTYQSWSGAFKKVIYLEKNTSVPWTIESKEYAQYNYKDTLIYELSEFDAYLSNIEKEDIFRITYDFHWNNILFEVWIFGYDQAMARKIIESTF